MTGPRASDEQLWSWVDAASPELERYLAEHPDEQARVDALRGAVGGVREAATRRLPERIGAYRVTGLLGEGGVGVVYEAEQENPRRRVAVKVLRGLFAGDARRAVLLRREAEALARLRHPGIATIHEAGTTEGGDPYLVMELVPGVPLDRHLAGRDVPRAARVEIVRRVAEAVQHAHEAGVVHRDLKPSNILVDESGTPRVVDFGLARIATLEGSLATRDSAAGTIVGTLPYMSPEQVRGLGGEVDARTDVYALGVILCEALGGRRPYDVDTSSIAAAIRTICEEPPRLPSASDPTVERDLDTIVLKALEKEPARRYATAGEFAADLARFLAHEPVVARRPSAVHRLRLFVRRHRTGAAVAAVAMLALVAFALSPAGADFTSRLSGKNRDKRAPFDEVRWRGDVPRVADGDAWLDLVAIDGVRAGLAVEFCKQTAGSIGWRKRFCEDLVEVLGRMGHSPGETVDLTLVDPATKRTVVRVGVAMTEERRTAVWQSRYRVPWRERRFEGECLVTARDGRDWTVESVGGVPTAKFVAAAKAADGARWEEFFDMRVVDLLTDETGESPGADVAVEVSTGAERVVVTEALSHENYMASRRSRRR